MTSPDVGGDQARLLSRYGRRFAAGDVIFQDGEPANEAFLLQEGRVRLIKRVGAIERGLRVLRPGDLFGESALMQGAPRNSTAVALDDSAALALDHATFQQVLASNPTVGARVLQQLIRRLRDAEDQIEILMLRDTQSKVVVALSKLAQQAAGTPGRADTAVSLGISPMELSARVGLDVDTVKRNVQELRESGYVRIVDERVEISDPDALRELFGLLGVKEQIVGGEGPREAVKARRSARR
jgi:CRP/FNR family cyclic AMP-dependent transcriptional regulator